MSLQLQSLEVDGECFDHYYLCHYRPLTSGADHLSKSLLHFKRGRTLDTEAWIECALAELKRLSFNKELLVLRALRHDEENPSNTTTSLDHLGREVARYFKGLYLPFCLSKIRKTRKFSLLSRDEREDELRNVYLFNYPRPIEEILILDDILTSGITLGTIIRVIRQKHPSCPIRLFTLACTDRQANNESLTLTSPAFSWEATKWNVVKEEEEGYYSMDQLKVWILTDTFTNGT